MSVCDTRGQCRCITQLECVAVIGFLKYANQVLGCEDWILFWEMNRIGKWEPNLNLGNRERNQFGELGMDWIGKLETGRVGKLEIGNWRRIDFEIGIW